MSDKGKSSSKREGKRVKEEAGERVGRKKTGRRNRREMWQEAEGREEKILQGVRREEKIENRNR